MPGPRFALCVALAATAVARGGPIEFADSVQQNPAERIFVTRVDLTDPHVTLTVANGGPDPDGAGAWETVLRTPSATAKANDFEVAVNGGFFTHRPRDGDSHHYFAGDFARGNNPVMVAGQFLTAAHIGPALVIDAGKHASVRRLTNPPPADARLIVGGSGPLVEAGKNVAGDDERAPRTAAGLADEGKTLVLLVVDGRRDRYSAGMTPKELAEAMIAQGCTEAINLDGGGSSAMVRKRDGQYTVVNTPSDGSTFMIPLSVERPVPYVLGVKISK